MIEPPPRPLKQFFQRRSQNFNSPYPQPFRRFFQSRWKPHLSHRGPYYPPKRHQKSSFPRNMETFRMQSKSNPRMSTNLKHVPSHLHVHKLLVSSTICHYCGAFGHVNSMCPHKRGAYAMNDIWVRKDVLRSLTNHSGPKNIWVPQVNV